jgi:hypothetical protein
MSASTVAALSGAEIPVVVPERASTLIVNAVPIESELSGAIKGRWSSSNRSASIGTQMIPEQCRTMKPMCSGVTFSAAKMRSPSFSRS